MKKLRTVFFFFILWLSLLLSLLLLPIYYLLVGIYPASAHRFIFLSTHTWGKLVLSAAGIRLSVKGKENFPEQGGFCIVANHQSYFDIPVLLSVFPYVLHFVAKREMVKIPFISSWMKLMGCSFINRTNKRQCIGVYHQEIDKIRKGEKLILFPEGTRGHSAEIGRFKPSSLRLFLSAGIPILPVTIQGAYHCYEAEKLIQKGIVYVVIHAVMPSHAVVDNIRVIIEVGQKEKAFICNEDLSGIKF
ncbi:MAG: lysophospholipid acyltransferase family protein [Bacteroidales bacterium]